ncbi:MAG: dockerin type I domain-containing protein [Nanoarchaeota archaeon]
MKKVFLLLISVMFLVSFVSADNRIFSGDFDNSYFRITPITPSADSVELTPSGNNPFYVLFFPSMKKHNTNNESFFYDSELGIYNFYFITDVPENTQKIKFYQGNSSLHELNVGSETDLSNFNIAYNNSLVNFSWQTSRDDYYTSIYYEDGNMIPLLFESWFNNSQEISMPLDRFYFSGYHKFKLSISDGFNEKESYFWFNVPYIGKCNGSDFNSDGIVDASDYITLKRNFGKTSATSAMGDSNGDGTVDFADLQSLQSNIGSGNCNQAIFPEIPAELLAQAAAESLTVSEAPSASSSSSRKTTSPIVSNSKSSKTPVTSNVIKENIESKEIKLNQPENKKRFLSKAIEALKRVFEFLTK